MAALDHTSRALTDIRDFLKKSWREKFPVQWEREQQLRAEGKWPEAKGWLILSFLQAMYLSICISI